MKNNVEKRLEILATMIGEEQAKEIDDFSDCSEKIEEYYTVIKKYGLNNCLDPMKCIDFSKITLSNKSKMIICIQSGMFITIVLALLLFVLSCFVIKF